MAWVARGWVPVFAAASAAGLLLSACTGSPGRHVVTPRAKPSTVTVLSPQASLYVVPAGGGAAHPLLRPDEAARLKSVSDPAWSPNGRWIAFAAGCVSCRKRLYVVSGNGRRLREIPTGRGSVSSPSWSPDGRAIVFSRQRGETQVLYSVNLGTARLRLVNGEPKGEDNTDTNPAWAPDGRWIAFSREVHHERVGLYLVSAARGRPKRMTRPTQFAQTHPSWSPDGRRLVYMQAVPPQITWDLFVLNVRTGTVQRITNSPHNEFDPSWSPDGRQLVFASDAASSSGFRALYVMGANGQGQRRLTVTSADDSMPSWSPDGAEIVFVRRPVVSTTSP
jgi:TolB protein